MHIRPRGRLGDSAQNLEQRALSGAVSAYNCDRFSLLDLKGHILQRPEFPTSRRSRLRRRSIGASA